RRSSWFTLPCRRCKRQNAPTRKNSRLRRNGKSWWTLKRRTRYEVPRGLERCSSVFRRRRDEASGCCDVESPEHVSFSTDAGAFPGHRGFQREHQGHKHERQHGREEKDIEISQRGCLLLAQILQCLPGQLLRGNGIAGLLQELRPRLIEEGVHRRVEGIEGFA